MTANIEKSKLQLEKSETHISELRQAIGNEMEGAAKDELTKILKRAREHADELEKHIKEGKRLQEDLED